MTKLRNIRRGWGWLKRNSLAFGTWTKISIKQLFVDMTITNAMRARYAERLNASGSQRNISTVISLTVPVRHLGVKSNYLERYLRELISKTTDLSRIEVLVKVDSNDDLRWFCKILDKYSPVIPLRFFVTMQEEGYASTNKFHHFLIKNRNPNSKIWILQSADTEILIEGWDEKLLNKTSSRDSKYFICTDATLDESISIKGPNPVSPQPVYWVRGTLFPIASTAVLDVLERECEGLNDWTMVGKTFNIDGFFGDMLRHLHCIHGIDLHVQVPVLFQEYKPEGWHGNPRREALRTRSLLDFFSESTQNIHKRFAAAIARKVQQESASQ